MFSSIYGRLGSVMIHDCKYVTETLDDQCNKKGIKNRVIGKKNAIPARVF